MAIAHEIEAKLLAPRPAELDAIAERRRLLDCTLVPRRRARLETTYVDTDGFALLAAGVCLRVRLDGGRSEATAKWMGEVKGDVHSRPELTVQLERGSLPSGAGLELPAGPLRDQLAAIVAGRRLMPILVTHIDRRIVDVVGEGARGKRVAVAELALDRVRSEGPGRRGRARAQRSGEYGEVELELRDGTVAELAALADALRREHGLLPTHETKFSRGMDAVYGQGVLARLRAAAPPPGPRDTVGAALRRALGAQCVRIREHDPGTRAGEDPEALHQQRVGVRRARAVLRAYGDALPPRRRAWLQRELRWLGRTLGDVRDLDVQLESCRQLGQALPAAEASALDAHVAELQAERTRQRQRMLLALGSSRYFELLCELEALGAERDVHGDGPVASRLLAAHGLSSARHALRALRKRGEKVALHASKASAEELHELRIRARRTRYVLEVLSELTGTPGRRVIEHLVRLQDALGEHQDAIVAADAIAAHEARLGVGSGSHTHRGLMRLQASERRRAQRARRDFARAFSRLDRKWRDVERMQARLEAAAKHARGEELP